MEKNTINIKYKNIKIFRIRNLKEYSNMALTKKEHLESILTKFTC